VIGTIIRQKTLLSSDYLNHFNDIIMLIELVPDAPEYLEECLQWRPVSYAEHFGASSIVDGRLAIEAYDLSPGEYRRRFDAVVADMEQLVVISIQRLKAAMETGDERRIRSIAEDSGKALRDLVAVASAVIHGETPVLRQSEIDEILRSWIRE